MDDDSSARLILKKHEDSSNLAIEACRYMRPSDPSVLIGKLIAGEEACVQDTGTANYLQRIYNLDG